jgi:hypothetical protein
LLDAVCQGEDTVKKFKKDLKAFVALRAKFLAGFESLEVFIAAKQSELQRV